MKKNQEENLNSSPNKKYYILIFTIGILYSYPYLYKGNNDVYKLNGTITIKCNLYNIGHSSKSFYCVENTIYKDANGKTYIFDGTIWDNKEYPYQPNRKDEKNLKRGTLRNAINYRNPDQSLIYLYGGDKYISTSDMDSSVFYFSFNIKGNGFKILPKINSYQKEKENNEEEEVTCNLGYCPIKKINTEYIILLADFSTSSLTITQKGELNYQKFPIDTLYRVIP